MHQLSVHNVHLRIADCENVAFQISRTRGLSFDCKEETVFGVHKNGRRYRALWCPPWNEGQ